MINVSNLSTPPMRLPCSYHPAQWVFKAVQFISTLALASSAKRFLPLGVKAERRRRREWIARIRINTIKMVINVIGALVRNIVNHVVKLSKSVLKYAPAVASNKEG